MSVFKDTKNNTWKVHYRFTDWQGKVHQSTKRGFPTKREALAWEREQLHKVEADLDMTFDSFIDTKACVTQVYDINSSDSGSNKVGRFCNAIIVYNYFFCSLLKIHSFTLFLK